MTTPDRPDHELPPPDELPEGLRLTRTTDTFDQETVPAGLRRAHRVAEGVWGRLVVSEGRLRFVWEDGAEPARLVAAGDSVVIPPGRYHHVETPEPVAFAVEFHRPDTV